MKHWILFFLFFSVALEAQKRKLDFSEIEKNLKEPASKYHYDRLIFLFKGYPKGLDTIEGQHLYYGRTGFANTISFQDPEFSEIAKKFQEKDYTECVILGKKLQKIDPTNLDVILILMKAYDQLKKTNLLYHHISQMRILADAIYASGDGKTENTPFVVNSINDEYIFLNLINKNKNFTRRSKRLKDGILDILEDSKEVIYIKIRY